MRSRIRTAVLAVSLGILPVSARAQPAPVGPEFQVNTYTTSGQYAVAVATDVLGNFVVVWDSYDQDGDTDGVFGQRYDRTGMPLGTEFQVSTYTTSYQFGPAVTADADGDFVVAWTSDQQDGDSFGIFAQRFDSTGARLGGEFQVNTYTTSAQLLSAVATDAVGNFVVVWESAFQDGSILGIFGQRYDSGGTPVGGEFQVNSYTPNAQEAPAVASDPAGNFVVVWQSNGQDGSGWGVFAQRYTSNGAAAGSEFQVNTYTSNFQRLPAVSRDAIGNFVVVWGSTGQDGAGEGIFGQRFAFTGAALGGEFRLNTYTTGDQFNPAVSADAGGNFVAAWDSVDQDGSDQGVFGRRYNSLGIPQGGEFQANTFTTSYQRRPAVSAGLAGEFVVVWESYGQDGVDRGVFGQRFGLLGQPTTTTSTPTSSTTSTTSTLPSALMILGGKIVVKDPTGSEASRRVVVTGRETSTDVGSGIVGNPAATGATLAIITKGATDSIQTYVLDASGWTTLGNSGFRYAGPSGADGDPVKKVILKRTQGGTAFLNVVLKGRIGTQNLAVVPPNPGDEGGVILAINGGSTYCVSFGGRSLGTETADTATMWKMVNPTAQAGCVTLP